MSLHIALPLSGQPSVDTFCLLAPDDNSEHLEGDMVYSKEFTVNEWSEGKVHYVFENQLVS